MKKPLAAVLAASVTLVAAPAVWAVSYPVADALLPSPPSAPTAPNISFPSLPTAPPAPTVPLFSSSTSTTVSTLPSNSSVPATPSTPAPPGDGGSQPLPSTGTTVVEVSPPPSIPGVLPAVSRWRAQIASVRDSVELFVPDVVPATFLEQFDTLDTAVSSGLVAGDGEVAGRLRALRAAFVEAVAGPRQVQPLREQSTGQMSPAWYAGEVAEALRWLDPASGVAQAARSALGKVVEDVAAGVVVSAEQMSVVRQLTFAALDRFPLEHVELVSAAMTLNGAAASLEGLSGRDAAADAAALSSVSRSLLWGSARTQAVKAVSDMVDERLAELDAMCDRFEVVLAPAALSDRRVAALVAVAAEVRAAPLSQVSLSESYMMLRVAYLLAVGSETGV